MRCDAQAAHEHAVHERRPSGPVTSSLPADGKTTVTANLAMAIAASGQPVVVVDGDLRRPMVAKTFGLVGNAGLTDVLIGRATLNEVMQPWGPTGRMAVLAAGSIPSNPSEMLASDPIRATLSQVAQHAIVLVDAPPLLPVTDAAILTAGTDGAIVVAYGGRTRVDALEQSLAEPAKVKGRVLGLVLNAVPAAVPTPTPRALRRLYQAIRRSPVHVPGATGADAPSAF